MRETELPKEFIDMLGPSMAMDVHWIDVKLKDGRVYKNMVVRGGRYLTGMKDDLDGMGDFPFEIRDIAKIRRASILPFF